MDAGTWVYAETHGPPAFGKEKARNRAAFVLSSFYRGIGFFVQEISLSAILTFLF
jgi:hypothetical protein